MMFRYPLFISFLVFAGILFSCKNESQQETNGSVVSDTTQQSKGFDELSSEYYENQSRVIWQKPDLVLNLLGDLRGKVVADVGAGTGFFSFRVANAGAKVIAIDIDPRALAWIENEKRRYPPDVQALVETRLAQPEDPNLKSNEADVVLLVNTYIYLEDRVAYFRNLKKGLKKNARVIIIDFKAIETPIGPGVEERIDLQVVTAELSKAGYTVSSADDQSLAYQYIVTAEL